METNKSGKSVIILSSVLLVMILSLCCVEIILSLTPPIARDALIHHLAIPKLWLENGGFYETRWAPYSYYPMNIDLLYLIPLYFNNDIFPNFIHMAFGIGTAVLIYIYLNCMYGRFAGLLGVLIFLSTPIVVRMSTVAYVDLGLTFFITASLLSFVQWRDHKYEEHKWFFLCALTMGLALGTKYNALIAWFFLSFAIVFVYSRDTNRQWTALRHGLIFFLISLLVFSPWLVKNIILTGNPVYPLLKGIFNMAGAGSAQGTASLVSGDTYMGIFKMREMLYGESFWETLLIPVRFFFQGQDHSDRFFDGVLNPILIVFVPFAFMVKSEYRNKLFFLFFALFFILMAFFLDQLRIRYILPAIPVLTILTVTGLINICKWAEGKARSLKYLLLAAVFCLGLLLIGKNFIYIKSYFQTIQPIGYVRGSESRDDYIQRHVQSYRAIRYINANTPAQSKILLILLAGRGYYLNRLYEEDASFGMDVIRKMIETSADDKSFRGYLNGLGCTHLLINMNLFRQFVQNNFTPEDSAGLYQEMKERMEKVYDGEGYAVYRIIP
jgi:hypothetical protein